MKKYILAVLSFIFFSVSLNGEEVCPIKVIDMTLAENEVFTPEISLKVSNVTDNDIAEFEVEVKCYNKYNQPVNRYNSGTNLFSGNVKGEPLLAEKNLPYKIEKYDCKKEWVGEGNWRKKELVCKEKKVILATNEKVYSIPLEGFDGTIKLKDFSIKSVTFVNAGKWEKGGKSKGN